MKQLDKIDKEILNILQDQGRITNSDLAGKVGLSSPSIIERIRKMEKAGIISKYSALINPKKVNKEIVTMVAISMQLHNESEFKRFYESIRKWPEVLECYHVTGDEDFIMKVAVKDITTYERFMFEKVMKISGVRNIRTFLVLSSVKENGKILVE